MMWRVIGGIFFPEMFPRLRAHAGFVAVFRNILLPRQLFPRLTRFQHSRPQSPRSFWPAAGIESSGWFQTRLFYANSEV